MRHHHDNSHVRHYGWDQTRELLWSKFYWKNMNQDIHNYVQACTMCQQIKSQRHYTYSQLVSLSILRRLFVEISMDFIINLLPSVWDNCVYDTVLVIVDWYIKIAKYLLIIKTIDAFSLTDLTYQHIFLVYGWPEGIILNQEPMFISAYWMTVCNNINVKQQLNTAFHPQTDGQTERQNSTLEQYLQCFCNWKQNN